MRLLKIALLATCTFLIAALVGCVAIQTDEQTVQTLCANDSLKLGDYSQRSLLGAGYKALEAERFDCAERLLSQARIMDSKDPYVQLNLGVVYQRTGRQEQARAAYMETIKLDSLGDGGQSEVAIVATQEEAIGRKMHPSEIARHNLNLLP